MDQNVVGPPICAVCCMEQKQVSQEQCDIQCKQRGKRKTAGEESHHLGRGVDSEAKF